MAAERIPRAKRQPKIMVTVVDDATSPKCEARCGLDLSSPETLKSTTDVLRKLFGNRVKVEHTSLASTEAGSLSEIAERVKSGDLVLPLLLVNGKPRISGYFDLHSLQEVIQAEIEMAAP
jgi:disulfide oxidoreductase YuzD